MTRPANRPRPQRRGDRLIDRDATAKEIATDRAVAVLDRLAVEMDRKWGIDALPDLVSIETSQKYGSALAKLNAAIAEADPEEVAARAAVCMRGLQAMDAEAESAGRPKADSRVLEYDLEGWKIGVLPDVAYWQTVADARPDLTLFTLREVALALQAVAAQRIDMATVRKHFPQAEIIDIRSRLPKGFFERGGDTEIPF